MITRIGTVTVVVSDQGEALKWYTEKLGLEKREESEMGPGQKWVTVGARRQKDLQLVLASWKWHGNRKKSQVGEGTTMVLETDDCKKDYKELKAKGVRFADAPEELPWGVSAVFVDPDGNPFNLLERRGA